MLRRAQIEHILRATAAVTNHQIDLYADGVEDHEALSDLIDGTIGHGSLFHRSFQYHGDGVGPETAILPVDWRERASEYHGIGAPDVVAICPDPDDIAVAKLCAWREKDIQWLRDAVVAGIVSPSRMRQRLLSGLTAGAPPGDEIARRLDALEAGAP